MFKILLTYFSYALIFAPWQLAYVLEHVCVIQFKQNIDSFLFYNNQFKGYFSELLDFSLMMLQIVSWNISVTNSYMATAFIEPWLEYSINLK